MQIVKWQPSVPSPVYTPTARLQPTSGTDWSRLEIKFSPSPKKTPRPPILSPPLTMMTAAELGLAVPSTSKVCLPRLQNSSQATAPTLSDAPIVKTWTPKDPVPAHLSQNTCLPIDAPVDDDVVTSFVAAKLPCFHDIDPFDLTTPPEFDLQARRGKYFDSQLRSTRCTLYHEGGYDLEEHILNSSQSLLNCEEGRMPGMVHAESATAQAYAVEVDWNDEPVVDWPYDILGDWNDDPVLDWNGEPVADWVDEAVDEYFDDLIMIEHDAETYDWTFLFKDRATSDCISDFSSRFSSMEVLPLPLRDSFMEEVSAYEGPVRELAETESNMCRVSRLAWDSESDFCIPAFF
ncbi:hypothetical protein E4T44_10725 [Aureobasidium sp. EXF-8845]|nr:hypothetical protein E4T44_10725 [Aureobasidium sp. EXF-8845]